MSNLAIKFSTAAYLQIMQLFQGTEASDIFSQGKISFFNKFSFYLLDQDIWNNILIYFRYLVLPAIVISICLLLICSNLYFSIDQLIGLVLPNHHETPIKLMLLKFFKSFTFYTIVLIITDFAVISVVLASQVSNMYQDVIPLFHDKFVFFLVGCTLTLYFLFVSIYYHSRLNIVDVCVGWLSSMTILLLTLYPLYVINDMSLMIKQLSLAYLFVHLCILVRLWNIHVKFTN